MKVAVVGAGWAGLAAAIRAREGGHEVALFEAAPMAGGRARSDDAGGDAGDAATDNGQHILLGGYRRTLALMRDVGVDVDAALLRIPLSMTHSDGSGFALSPDGNRLLSGLRALRRARGYTLVDKLALAATALRWQAQGFRCAPALTVEALLRATTTANLRAKLLDPLCVAALNTPPGEASAAVFLAVMRDSLFRERDACDLLLPQVPLARLLPLPALAWLRAHGADVRLRRRVGAVARDGARWRVDEEADFDRVILAVPAGEAARLAAPVAPGWAPLAAALRHEPIVTVVLSAPHRPWPAPMLALASDDLRHPAQFAFKLGPQAATLDRVTLVVSAAGPWLSHGADAVATAAAAQYRSTMAIGSDDTVRVLSTRAERRATFRCIAGVHRPPMSVAPGLLAAADYVDGPYPATLEAAVRAGEAAALALTA